MNDFDTRKETFTKALIDDYAAIRKIPLCRDLMRKYKIDLISIYGIRHVYKTVLSSIDDFTSEENLLSILDAFDKTEPGSSTNSNRVVNGIHIGSEMCRKLWVAKQPAVLGAADPKI